VLDAPIFHPFIEAFIQANLSCKISFHEGQVEHDVHEVALLAVIFFFTVRIYDIVVAVFKRYGVVDELALVGRIG